MPSNELSDKTRTLKEGLKDLVDLLADTENRIKNLQEENLKLATQFTELLQENKRLENMITSLTKELLLTRKQARKS